MKRRSIILNLLLFLLLIPLNVNAIEGTGNSVGSSGFGSVTGDTYWVEVKDAPNKYSLRGIRITLYEFDNNVSTAKTSIDFVKYQEFADYLKDTDINYFEAGTSRLEYSRGKASSTIMYGKITAGVKVNENLPLFFESSEATLESFFIPGGSSFNEEKVKEFLDYFRNDKTKSSQKYYYVIEPTLTLRIHGKYFYGTSYEIIKFIRANKWGNSLTKIDKLVRQSLPFSLFLNSVSNPDKANFKGFLSSVGMYNNLAEGSKRTLSIDEILNKTYGMGILWDGDFNIIEEEPTETHCKTTFNYTSDSNSIECGSIGVKEDSRKECVLGNDLYYTSNYNDQTSIYCSNETISSFNDFYTTFTESVRSGSYFPMNDLVINNKKTCYINTINLNSASGWQDVIKNIEQKYSSNITLNVGNRTYNLLEKVSYNDVKCISSQNGICTGATLETKYTYSLNPLTNRFISITSMKEDSCISEETCKSISTNIDNGGPNLTVPLNYSSGIYKYKLDLKNSIFNILRQRLKKIDATVKEIDGKKYQLDYSYSVNNNSSTSVMQENLLFSCPYKVSKDQCIDENGEIYSCEINNDCTNLGEDECCINGEKTVCPPACNYECCDTNGKEISCPGGNSFIGKVIYRPISLTDPFPGIEGNGRIPGNNWNKIYKTSDGKGISYSEYYITSRRGYKDYEIYQAEPLYVIKLDGEKIQAIRKYNDKHDYNDFELSCVNGENCISSFLRGETKDFSINLIESGTCKNINSSNFDSCIKNKG